MNDQGRILTCVYCGMEYPQDTPAWGDKVLTDHIKICPKHPMRKLEEKLNSIVSGIFDIEIAEEMANESPAHYEITMSIIKHYCTNLTKKLKCLK